MPIRALFNPDREGVTLSNPEVVPHVLRDRDSPTYTYIDFAEIPSPEDGHSAPSLRGESTRAHHAPEPFNVDP
jgi:hypothetical protein